jgi:hypothetical protein
VTAETADTGSVGLTVRAMARRRYPNGVNLSLILGH